MCHRLHDIVKKANTAADIAVPIILLIIEALIIVYCVCQIRQGSFLIFDSNGIDTYGALALCISLSWALPPVDDYIEEKNRCIYKCKKIAYYYGPILLGVILTAFIILSGVNEYKQGNICKGSIQIFSALSTFLLFIGSKIRDSSSIKNHSCKHFLGVILIILGLISGLVTVMLMEEKPLLVIILAIILIVVVIIKVFNHFSKKCHLTR